MRIFAIALTRNPYLAYLDNIRILTKPINLSYWPICSTVIRITVISQAYIYHKTYFSSVKKTVKNASCENLPLVNSPLTNLNLFWFPMMNIRSISTNQRAQKNSCLILYFSQLFKTLRNKNPNVPRAAYNAGSHSVFQIILLQEWIRNAAPTKRETISYTSDCNTCDES